MKKIALLANFLFFVLFCLSQNTVKVPCKIIVCDSSLVTEQITKDTLYYKESHITKKHVIKVPVTSVTRDTIYYKVTCVETNSYCDSIVSAPVSLSDYMGLGSFSGMTVQGSPNPADPFSAYNTKIHRIIINADEFCVSNGVYNWPVIDTAISKFVASGKYILLQFITGDRCPAFVYSQYGSFTTTGTDRTGPYPDYRNEDYRQWWFMFNRDVQEHINNLSDNLKSRVVGLFMCFGVTGDEIAHKGTPENGYEEIGDEEWDGETKRYWDSIVVVAERTGLENSIRLAFNATPQFYYHGYFYDRYTSLSLIPMFKNGNAAHFYEYDGWGINTQTYDTLSFDEAQFPNPLYFVKKRKEERCVIWQSLHRKVSTIQISQSFYRDLKITGETYASPRITDPISIYANSTNRGFLVPTGQIMYDDTEHYPEAVYGNIIKPGNENAYANQVAVINARPTDWRSKLFMIYNRIRANINYSRVNAILYANPGSVYDTIAPTTSTSYKQWDNDIFINGILNWKKNLDLINPYGQTKQQWRFGEDTSMWGRAGISFKNGIGSTIDFDINDNIKGSTSKNNIVVTVHYLDSGTGKWSLYANAIDRLLARTVTKTNTGLIKSISLSLDDMIFQQPGAKDIWLRYDSGDNTTFAGFEIINNSK